MKELVVSEPQYRIVVFDDEFSRWVDYDSDELFTLDSAEEYIRPLYMYAKSIKHKFSYAIIRHEFTVVKKVVDGEIVE